MYYRRECKQLLKSSEAYLADSVSAVSHISRMCSAVQSDNVKSLRPKIITSEVLQYLAKSEAIMEMMRESYDDVVKSVDNVLVSTADRYVAYYLDQAKEHLNLVMQYRDEVINAYENVCELVARG